METVNSTSASKVAGNLKRRTVCTDEVHSSAKRTRLEAYSEGLSVSSVDEEDPIQKPTWLEKVSCPESSKNGLFTACTVSSDDNKEDLKQSYKKMAAKTHTYFQPTPKTIVGETAIQKNHSDEDKLNFKQSNKVDVSNSVSFKQNSIIIPNTLPTNAEGKIKNSFESSVELFKEDISKCSQEFLRLLLMDIEEQENDQSKKTSEFLPFVHHRTPHKTDRQDNLISSFAICAPSKNINAFGSLSSGQLRKNKLENENNDVASIWIDRATLKTSEITNYLSNMTINSVIKKTESSKRKLNFQDLCVSDVNKKILKCLPNESCDKEESDSNDSDATFVDAYEPQVVDESFKSKCSLPLEENQDRNNESNKADCKDSIGGRRMKSNKPFPFIFSQQYKAGYLNETSGEQKSKPNNRGCKANLIEWGSNSNDVTSIQIDRATLKTSEVTNSLSNMSINSLIKKTESEDSCVSDVNKELFKCLPNESYNKEDNDSGESDATFVDAYEPQIVGESLKSKYCVHLEENQVKKNESNNKAGCKDSIGGTRLESNKPFPYIFSQQYKAGHTNESNGEQKSKSNIQGCKANLIEGNSQEKSKIISNFIIKTTNNASNASKLNFQNLCMSDKDLEKYTNLSGTEKVGCSNSPIESNNEEANDSDDSDVTFFDRDSSITVKEKKSFPFVFSQPTCKADQLRKGKTYQEQKMKPNSESKSLELYLGNNSEKVKEHSRIKDFIFLEDKPNRDKESIFGNTNTNCEIKRLDLKDLENNLEKNKAHSQSKDSTFLKDNPIKERIFENATSSCINDYKNGFDSYPFFFSQPQCKADESRLNKKDNQIRDELWKSRNNNPPLNWIEKKSQELLRGASDFNSYKNYFQESKKDLKLTGKKDVEKSTTNDNFLASICEQSQEDDSDDSDVTLFDLKNRLDSKRKNLKTRDSIYVKENQNNRTSSDHHNKQINRDSSITVKEKKSFPFVFSQPMCKADQLRQGKIHQEQKLKPNSESLELYFGNVSEKVKEHSRLKSFIFREDNPSRDQESIFGNTNTDSESKRLDLKDLENNLEKNKAHSQANLIEGESDNNAVASIHIDRATLTTSEVTDSLSDMSIDSLIKKTESEDLCVSDVNKELLKCLPNESYNKEDNDFGESDATFVDAYEPRVVGESLKSKCSLHLEVNQVKKNESNNKADCKDKPFPFIFSQQYKADHINESRGEQKSKSNFEGCKANLIEGESQEKSETISNCIFKTTNNASSKLNFQNLCISDKNLEKSRTLSDTEKVGCSYSPIESNDCDMTLFDLKNSLDSKRKILKSRGFIYLDEDATEVHRQLQENKPKESYEDIQKQQDPINFDDRSNVESENLMLIKDTESCGENVDRFLKDIDNALAKIKMTLTTESEQPAEKENSRSHLLGEVNEENEDDFASNPQNAKVDRLEQDANQITLQDFCVLKMKDNKHYSTLQNKTSLFVNATEFEDFTKRHLEILSNQILAHVEQNVLSQQPNVSIRTQRSFTLVCSNRDEVNLSQKSSGENESTGFTRTFINRTRSNGALSTGSKENFTLPEKRLRQGLNHVIGDRSLLCHEKHNSSSKLSRLRIIEKLSEIFMRLRDDVIQKRSPILEIRDQRDWGNCLFINNRVMMKPLGEAKTTIINFHRNGSKLHFNLIIFLLGKVINMLSEDSSCTKRELYYQLIKFVKSESQVSNAIDHISCLLDEPPWQLGITAMSKGLIYGDLKIVASDQMINCNVPGGSLVPRDVQKITQLVSDAYFILIVEKDAIFQKLLKEDLPNKLTRPFVMITGKGYPDVNLRFFIKKLMMAMSVPVFILVDADPYGIEIMLTYRFGSIKMSHLNEHLAVPNARWIGVYPSEIIELNVSHQPLTKKDVSKIKSILKRPYCASFSKLKDEMEILLRNNFKAEIEGLLKSDTSLRDFYLPNKFLTQDYI